MQSTESDYKRRKQLYFGIGLFCFFLQFVMAVVFYKERVAFSDTAFQFVHLLIEQKPVLMPVRFGAVLSQLITLTAIWLHCSLRTAMIIHSISTLILYFILFLLAYRFSRRGFMFLMIPFGLILFANDVFFWQVSDVQLGLVWLGLYSVFLFEESWAGSKLSWLFHFLLILWIQIFHLLLFFPIVVLIIYYYDSRSRLFSKHLILHLSLCLIAFAIRYHVAENNWYEGPKLQFTKNLQENLPLLFSLSSFQAFTHRLLSYYLICTLVMGFITIWLALRKKYLLLLTVVSFTFMQLIMVFVTEPDGAPFYIENMLLPIGFILLLPFVSDILPAVKSTWLTLAVLSAIFIRVFFITQSDHVFAERRKAFYPYIAYAKKNQLSGVIVKEDMLADKKKLILAWGTGYESMLLSSLPSPDSCTIVQFDNDIDHYRNDAASDTLLVTSLRVWAKSKVPQQYFRLRGKYEIIKEAKP